MSIWHCPQHGVYGGQTHCPACGRSGSYVDVFHEQGGTSEFRPVPWWEQALHTYADEYGPSGSAWNISAILDLLRRSNP